jgi:prepilin-type N-terminal cleavage/methylation domain-containing protein
LTGGAHEGAVGKRRKIGGTTMYKRLHEARKNESGFTLIELLIVIVILGVLAGIVVFAVSGINDTSKKSACKSDLKNVEIASEAYYAQSNPHTYATAIGATGSVVATELTGAKLLREAPSTDNGYTILYNATTGVVTTAAGSAC